MLALKKHTSDLKLFYFNFSYELASFKEEQPPYCSNAASHMGAAVLAHVARSGRLDVALRWMELNRRHMPLNSFSTTKVWTFSLFQEYRVTIQSISV